MSRVLLGLISAVLVFLVSGCAGLAAGAESNVEAKSGSQSSKVERPTPEPTRPPPTLAEMLGEDGRLTALILGSDERDGVLGARTDAIIVATIDPETGKVAMVSLPRDTVNVPIAPGKVHRGRINGLYGDYLNATGKPKQALKKLKKALAYAFDTEIDYYAMVDFDSLVRLINRIGGVDVTLDEPFVDSTMHLGEKGLRLKAGERHLDGKKALAFSRSRHTDSDYGRSRRQQQVLAAAAEQVRSRGVAALPALVELSRNHITTDIPWRGAPALLELAGKAKLGNPKSIVLQPIRWARELSGTYTVQLRVLEVQKMFDRVFSPLD